MHLHAPPAEEERRRSTGGAPGGGAPGVVFALTAAVLLAEVAGGILSGSLALLSDAGHMLADLFALALAILARRFAARPATADKSYGFYRLEILAALANGVLLSVTALLILREAVARWFLPRGIESGLMLAVASLGLAANLAAAWLLGRGRPGLALRSVLAHVVGDALSSAGVIAGAIAIRATGNTRIDPLLGALIALAILWSAARVVREAVDVLLEATPRGIRGIEVSRVMRHSPGVVDVHDLHVWSLTTGVPALSAHVLVRREDLCETDRILRDLNRTLLDRFGIGHTTLQIESEASRHVCPVSE